MVAPSGLAARDFLVLGFSAVAAWRQDGEQKGLNFGEKNTWPQWRQASVLLIVGLPLLLGGCCVLPHT